MNAKPMLLVNLAQNPNHWIGIATVGTKSNRDGIGAKVSVIAAGKTYVAEVRSGGSYISDSDMRLHFGLGAATTIDRLTIRWPTGITETFSTPTIDRIVTLTEGTGTPNSH